MGKIVVVSKYKSEIVAHLKENKVKAEDAIMVCMPQDLEGVKEADEVVVLSKPWYGFDEEAVVAKLVKKAAPAAAPKKEEAPKPAPAPKAAEEKPAPAAKKSTSKAKK